MPGARGTGGPLRSHGHRPRDGVRPGAAGAGQVTGGGRRCPLGLEASRRTPDRVRPGDPRRRRAGAAPGSRCRWSRAAPGADPARPWLARPQGVPLKLWRNPPSGCQAPGAPAGVPTAPERLGGLRHPAATARQLGQRIGGPSAAFPGVLVHGIGLLQHGPPGGQPPRRGLCRCAALAGALVTGGRLGRGEARRDPAVHLGYGCIKVQTGPLALGP
jgi:hypothetical protein